MMGTEQNEKQTDEPQSFEMSFTKIETMVRQLEQGTLGLDESLAIYQSAVKHLRYCHGKLADAQRKVEILRDVQPDGSVDAEAFDDAASTLQEKSASRTARRSATSTRKAKSEKDLLP